VAALTDILDGHLARKMGQVSNFGKFIDPLADKLMMMAALFCFVQMGTVGAVPAIVILAREFIVTSLRMVAVEQGLVIGAGVSGKIKIVTQTAAVAFLFTPLWNGFNPYAVWGMVAVTVWSGVDYLWKHGKVLSKASAGE